MRQQADKTERPQQREQSRARRLAAGVATSLVSRGLGTLGPIFLLPILLPALGPRLFGVWAAATAMASLVAWADLGLGASLMTRLAGSEGKTSPSAPRMVRSAYAIVGTIAVAICLILVATAPLVNWGGVVGVSGGDSTLAEPIILGVLLLLALNVVGGLVHRVLNGLQMISLSNIILSLGGVVSLFLAVAAVWLGLSPIVVAVAASAGPFVVNTATTGWLFFVHWPEARPTFVRPTMFEIKGLAGLGAGFLAISVLSAVSLTLDPVFVANLRGAEQAGQFAFAARVVGVLGLTITLVNAPLWPVQAEAMRHGDLAWVRRATRTMILVSLGTVAVGGVVLMLLRQPLFNILGAGTIQPHLPLIAALALWWCLVAGVSPMFMVQNAAGIVRPQLVGWGCMAVGGTALKIAVLKSNMSIVTMVSLGAVAYAALVVPFAIFGYRKALSLVVAQELPRTEVAPESAIDGGGK